MADAERRSDIFTAISIVTLVFMLIGIGVAVLQWTELAAEPQRGLPVITDADVPGPKLLKGAEEGTGAVEEGGEVEPGTDTGAGDEPEPGAEEPDAGDEEIEF